MAKKTFSKEGEARIREILAKMAKDPKGNADITVYYESWSPEAEKAPKKAPEVRTLERGR